LFNETGLLNVCGGGFSAAVFLSSFDTVYSARKNKKLFNKLRKGGTLNIL